MPDVWSEQYNKMYVQCFYVINMSINGMERKVINMSINGMERNVINMSINGMERKS